MKADDALGAVGIGPADKISVKKFLNRLLGLPVGMQNKLFNHFSALLDLKVKEAKDTGQFDDGAVDVRGELTVRRGSPRTLATDPLTNVRLQHYTVDVDRGMCYEARPGPCL